MYWRIRCEKSTAFLLQQGFEQVYHLEGGILNYLEKIKAEESLWQGECFVFDERVTVDHQLERGSYRTCPVCDQIVDKQGLVVERIGKFPRECPENHAA